jgi:hypothetical protein
VGLGRLVEIDICWQNDWVEFIIANTQSYFRLKYCILEKADQRKIHN